MKKNFCAFLKGFGIAFVFVACAVAMVFVSVVLAHINPLLGLATFLFICCSLFGIVYMKLKP